MVTRLAAAWNRFWFAETPLATVALFRIALGLVVLGWAASIGPDLHALYFPDGIVGDPRAATPARLTPPVGLLTLAHHGWQVQALHAALVASALAVIVGLGTRVASMAMFVLLASFHRQDPFVIDGGDSLVRMLCLYLALMPAGAWLSLDRLRRHGRAAFWQVPVGRAAALRLVQVQLCIVYLGAAWSKLHTDAWRDGSAISYALRLTYLDRLPVPQAIAASPGWSALLSISTIAIELAIPLMVWRRSTRWIVLMLGVGLHLGIEYALATGFFSFAMFAGYVAFAWPDRAMSVVARLTRRQVTLEDPTPPPAPRATRRPVDPDQEGLRDALVS